MSEQFVVVSKVKKFIKSHGGMNTSANVMDQLSKIVQEEINKAIQKAQNDNRRTVMDRDFSEN